VHIRINNIEKKYVNGELERVDNYYDIHRCTHHEFFGTEFEFQFYNQMKANSKYNYCARDDEIYLHGTRDSATRLQDHAYIIYEVHKCNEDTRHDDDPECAPMDEINEWLD